MLEENLFGQAFSFSSAEKAIKPKNYTNIPFFTLTTIYFFLLLFLFAKQIASPNSSQYFSDFPAHINLGLSGDIYSLTQLIAWFSGFIPAFILPINALCLAVAIVFTIYYARRFAIKLSGSYSIILDLSVFLLFICAMIWNPFNPDIPYVKAGSPNVWHNSTAIYCRLFALISLDALTEAIKSYYLYKNRAVSKSFVVSKYLFLTLACSLATFAKPSFSVVFMPACFIYMVYQLIKTKGGSFFPSFFTGLAFIPSIPIALLQNIVLYSETVEQSNIAFMPFEYILIYNETIPSFFINLLLVSAFPLFIYLSTFLKHRTIEHIIYLSTFFGLILYLFFGEEGYRFTHGNLSWSFIVTLFFAFYIAAIRLVDKNTNKIVKIIGSALFTLHIIGGVAYFGRLLGGSSFY